MHHILTQQIIFFSTADIIVTTNGEPVTSKEIKSCIHQIQELIVVRLNQAVANKLISSVDYLRESFVGTLERCLNSLEKSNIESSVHNITSNHLKQVGKQKPYSVCRSRNVKCEQYNCRKESKGQARDFTYVKSRCLEGNLELETFQMTHERCSLSTVI